jgi:hypothetical protein
MTVVHIMAGQEEGGHGIMMFLTPDSARKLASAMVQAADQG